MTIRYAIAAACALGALSSVAVAKGWNSVTVNNQRPVVGNGQIVTQRRPVGDFNRISVGGSSDIIVRVGPRPSLTVTADSNLLPLLESEIRHGELNLRPTRSYRSRSTPRFVVTVPDIRELSLAGSGNGQVEGVSGRELALSIAGSGNLVGSGRTGNLKISVAGSGNADLRSLRADRVAVNIAGSGDVQVATNGPITGAIAGSGSVRYAGRPTAVQVARIGSGSVAPLR